MLSVLYPIYLWSFVFLHTSPRCIAGPTWGSAIIRGASGIQAVYSHPPRPASGTSPRWSDHSSQSTHSERIALEGSISVRTVRGSRPYRSGSSSLRHLEHRVMMVSQETRNRQSEPRTCAEDDDAVVSPVSRGWSVSKPSPSHPALGGVPSIRGR